MSNKANKIIIGGVSYNIEDTETRNLLNSLEDRLDSINPDIKNICFFDGIIDNSINVNGGNSSKDIIKVYYYSVTNSFIAEDVDGEFWFNWPEKEKYMIDNTINSNKVFIYNNTFYNFTGGNKIIIEDSQLNICNSVDLVPHGWNNVDVNKTDVSIFGEVMSGFSVTFTNPSTTGNYVGFTYETPHMSDGTLLGNHLNWHIFLYSPIELSQSVFVRRYPEFNHETNYFQNRTIEIKKGWNSYYFQEPIVGLVNSYPEIYFTEDSSKELVGQTILVKAVGYLGNKKNFLPNLKNIFVEKEVGKQLVSTEEVDKWNSLCTSSNIINNIASERRFTDTSAPHTLLNKEDGFLSVRIEPGKSSETGSYWYINFELNQGIYWKKNHVYYIAMDILVENCSWCPPGELYYNNLNAKYSNPIGVADGNNNIVDKVKVGERGLLTWKLNVNHSNIDTYPTANRLFYQVSGGKMYPNDTFVATIYSLRIIDLGISGTIEYLDWNFVDKIVRKNTTNLGAINFTNFSLNSLNAETAEFAKSIGYKDIELWGDSLTQQNYGQYLKTILNRNVYSYGYGGKGSTYIRDRFLEQVNKDRLQVIWVGRNNSSKPDNVVDDIREMVSELGNTDFIIMSPPNGHYGNFGEGITGEDGGGEMKGGTAYKYYKELDERLAAEYPSNFLNIREAVIHGWKAGNIKLLTGFTQPEIGSTVTINVSNADFLTTYNSNDLSRFGEDMTKKLRIGINGAYDIYKIISKIDDTHLSVELEKINRITAGQVVDNIADSDGCIEYVRVIQNLDYLCWLYDTTLSTFRKDGIHMTDEGLKLVAEVVARKIKSMGK